MSSIFDAFTMGKTPDKEPAPARSNLGLLFDCLMTTAKEIDSDHMVGVYNAYAQDYNLPEVDRTEQMTPAGIATMVYSAGVYADVVDMFGGDNNAAEQFHRLIHLAYSNMQNRNTQSHQTKVLIGTIWGL